MPRMPKRKTPQSKPATQEKTPARDPDVTPTPYGDRKKSNRKRPRVSLPSNATIPSDKVTDVETGQDEVGEDDGSKQHQNETIQKEDSPQEHTVSIGDNPLAWKFVNEVAPSVGLAVYLAEDGDSPFMPNATWHCGDETCSSYLVIAEKPLLDSAVPQYSFSLPLDFFEHNNSDASDFYVIVYLRFTGEQDDINMLTGVWMIHIQELFEMLDSASRAGEEYVFDVRHLECYSVNTMGNPVKLVVE